MKIAIMQPYFLPYLGYFGLIKHTDKFILLDTVQFINHGWIERNRILKHDTGWTYIAAPLIKHGQRTMIKNIQINTSLDWKSKIFAQLVHYKKRAPFYNQTIEVLKAALDLETDSIVKMDEHILKVICEYIGIYLDIGIFSELNLKIDTVNAPDEWALNICKSIGANVKEYWNPHGGMEFFDRDKFEQDGIKINFLKMNINKYKQMRSGFEEALSIVDVMMFNKPEKIYAMLDDIKIL